MVDIPPAFLENMQRLLGNKPSASAEYQAFLESYHQPATIGLRVNTLKISTQDFQNRFPYGLKPLPWSSSGFFLQEAPHEKLPPPGKHPYHAAGLYYLQEPSAMAVAETLQPKEGERVLDLCAAPGGKATHLAALMKDQGLLVVNETHTKRAWELVENLERWGVHNTVILNESPKRLADHFGAIFDKVLVDAPCSGEGMFRKDTSARREWTPKLVRSCAIRQSAILDHAAKLVRSGGCLAYSTCTFNPQENEGVVASFLKRHPEFELEAIPLCSGYSTGRPEWIESGESLPGIELTVRLWPHQTIGEGHFIALLRCKDQPESVSGKENQPLARKEGAGARLVNPSMEVAQLIQNSCRDNLLLGGLIDLGRRSRLALVGSYLYQLPEITVDLSDLRVIHPGWWLGSIKTGKRRGNLRFEPSHAMAMGIQAIINTARIESIAMIKNTASDLVRQTLDLDPNGAEVFNYLHGETLPVEAEDGWILITVDGFPLGWGKMSRGKMRNLYPRGLRWL